MSINVDELLAKQPKEESQKPSTESTIQEKLGKATEEEKEKLVAEFLARFNRPIVRGNGGQLASSIRSYVESDDWRMVELAKLFDFDLEIINRLSYSQEEIINRTNAAELILQIEQIKLLRKIETVLSSILLSFKENNKKM